MSQFNVKRWVSIVLPAVLFIVFALMITFPSRVPFLNVRLKSSAGIETARFTVPGPASERSLLSFEMKKVPSGIAPGGTMDIPGAVTVPSPFWIGRTEVTRGLYRAVSVGAEALGYEVESLPPPLEQYSGTKPDTLPAEEISWAGAAVWCNLLSERLSLEPVYRRSGADGEPVRRVEELLKLCESGGPAVNPNADGFRLPYSGEWEFAARYRDGKDWTSGTWPSGGIAAWIEFSRADLVACYDRDSSSPVGSLASNALGLFDMSGNVWEWCFDSFVDSESDIGYPSKRVTRGGSWMGNAWRIQIGGTFGTAANVRDRGQGFRLARGDVKR